MTQPLDAEALFPEYAVQTVAGEVLQIPKGLDHEYSVLLFYRGGW